MYTNFPRKLNCLFLSLAFLDMDVLNNHNLLEINDYIYDIVEEILNLDDIQIYCQYLAKFYITRIILLCNHFNNNSYKSNLIIEKFFYIIFYYIQDKRNIKNLFDENNSFLNLQLLNKKLNVFKSSIPKLLHMIIYDIETQIKESRKESYIILKEEYQDLPTDIIHIIIDYMPAKSVLILSELY